MSEEPKTLFLWRGQQDISKDLAFDPWYGWQRACPFCSIDLTVAAREDREGGVVDDNTWVYALSGEEHDDDPSIVAGGGEYSVYEVCPLCGWIIVNTESFLFGLSGQMRVASTLQEFRLDDPAISLTELGAYLKRAFSDVYSLSWERFEDIVADVFRRNHDGQVVQTARTADGGADILLLSLDGQSIDAVVECKRYAKERKVGVDLVRKIVGVCVDWQVDQAVIVTSSAFTSNAADLAARFRKFGFIIDLIGADELVRSLESYNEALPRLGELSSRDREELILQNRAMIGSSIVIPKASTEDHTSQGRRFRRVVKRFI